MPSSWGWNLLISGPSHRLNRYGPVCFTRKHQMLTITNIFPWIRKLLHKKHSSFLERVSLAASALRAKWGKAHKPYCLVCCLSFYPHVFLLVPHSYSGVLENRAGSALLKSKSWVLFPSKGELKTSFFRQLSCFQSTSHFYLQKFPTLPISKPFQESACRWVYHWFPPLKAY